MPLGFRNDYNKTDWQNRPSQKTPLAKRLLDNIENGIKEAYNRLVQLDTHKADLDTVNTLVKSVSLNSKTGILTVTLLNGTAVAYDLDIEKVVLNFDITDDNKLVLTLADGTRKEIDLTRFVYSVASTDTVSMTIRDRVMRAEIVDGSVTMAKLDAAIQTTFRQYMLDAQAARDAALQYQGFAERYALGNEAEFPGSGTDNAKHYWEQSKAKADSAKADAKTATDAAATSTEQAGIATQKATAAAASASSASGSAALANEKAQAAAVSEAVAGQRAAQAAASVEAASQKVVEAGQKVTEAGQKVTEAGNKAAQAAASADLAQRYASGGVVPEDSQDNAKWYYQQCMTLKEEIDATADLVIPQFSINFEDGGLYSDKAAKGMRFWVDDGGLYSETEVTA